MCGTDCSQFCSCLLGDQSKLKIELGIEDPEIRAPSYDELVAGLQKRIEQYDSEIRGDDAGDRYLVQVYNQQLSAEMDLLDQVFESWSFISNSISLLDQEPSYLNY